MSKTLTKNQASALYYIELDGGLMKSKGAFQTLRGRQIAPDIAQWLIKNNHLLAHQDGLFEGHHQTWEVLHKMGVEPRS